VERRLRFDSQRLSASRATGISSGRATANRASRRAISRSSEIAIWTRAAAAPALLLREIFQRLAHSGVLLVPALVALELLALDAVEPRARDRRSRRRAQFLFSRGRFQLVLHIVRVLP